jgi:hypothetical protein
VKALKEGIKKASEQPRDHAGVGVSRLVMGDNLLSHRHAGQQLPRGGRPDVGISGNGDLTFGAEVTDDFGAPLRPTDSRKT